VRRTVPEKSAPAHARSTMHQHTRPSLEHSEQRALSLDSVDVDGGQALLDVCLDGHSLARAAADGTVDHGVPAKQWQT
jgi:hypothetical protein